MKRAFFCAAALAAGCAAAFAAPDCISGVYPHLAMSNDEGECGTGAVVPWAGDLWAVTYGPHRPVGSSDKLYRIKPDLTREVFPGSVGGTHANRLVHRETDQLLIGPYAIDAKGNVRVVPPSKMPGRLTAAARHLSDSNKVYVATMETGLYELDMRTLAVETLVRENGKNDKEIAAYLKKSRAKWPDGWSKAPRTRVPGYHSKGLASGFGRVFVSNNGEDSEKARRDPFVPSGVLAWWNEKGKDWSVIRRCQFTEVTTPDGIYGNEHPETNPVWAMGWDAKSVILGVTTNGTLWAYYRLPKASHSYDGAHGWNTEWPRIRDVGFGDGTLLATMHGTFWRFPASFGAASVAGLRPISTHLKVTGDFCRFGDEIVFGCDDTAKNEFLNKRKVKGSVAGPERSNSNLWFVKPDALGGFGPAIGRGAVWLDEDVKEGDVSDPYLLAGYDRRSLYVSSADGFSFDIEVDEKGDGKWRRLGNRFSCAAGRNAAIVPLEEVKGEWVRLVAKRGAKGVTAVFNYENEDRRSARPDGIFDGIGGETTQMGDCQAVVLSGGGVDLKLKVLDVTCNSAGGYYEMGSDLKLKKVAPCNSREADEMRRKCSVLPNTVIVDGYGVKAEEASILIVDGNGGRWRFPWGGAWRSASCEGKGQTGRTCREVCTERDLLNVGGTFYELPAENAGGYAKVRPIATHGNFFIYDFCTWRGLLAVTGVKRFGRADNPRIVTCEDAGSTAAVWLGVVDDLWRFGKPRGCGGPWLQTRVAAGVQSDPFLMTGFDRKRVMLTADEDVEITLEIDLTGMGNWALLKTYKVKKGETATDDISRVRAYWVRATAGRDCTATVQFDYR